LLKSLGQQALPNNFAQIIPDEERNWRPLISFEEVQANKKLDVNLLKAIVEAIDSITK
jgi:hypothetical protein